MGASYCPFERIFKLCFLYVSVTEKTLCGTCLLPYLGVFNVNLELLQFEQLNSYYFYLNFVVDTVLCRNGMSFNFELYVGFFLFPLIKGNLLM